MRKLSAEELRRLKAKGAARVIERKAPLEAVPKPEPLPEPKPAPVEPALERLVREEQATRAALVEAITDLQERDPSPRGWRFTVTERDGEGYIRSIEAVAF